LNSWLTVLLGSGFGAALLYACVELVKTFTGRKVVQATAADRIADSALAMIEAARADAERSIAQARAYASDVIAQAAQDVAAARRDTDEARRDAAEARREATAARKEAMDASASMRRLTTEIMSPYASLDRLRALVGDGGTTEMNGRIA